MGENPLHDVYLSIGLGERGSAGSEIVQDESAFVHLGEESRPHESLSDYARDDQDRSSDEHATAMAEHSLERVLISEGQRIELVSNPVQKLAGRVRLSFRGLRADVFGLGVRRGEELVAHERDDREGQQQRHQHRYGQRDGQCGKELSDDAFEQSQRQEDDHGGKSRGGYGPDQLLNRFAYRLVTVWVEPHVTHDVLGDHNRVVNDQSDRDCHRAKGHQVERLADQVHGEDADRQRERDRRRADCGDARVVEEE